MKISKNNSAATVARGDSENKILNMININTHTKYTKYYVWKINNTNNATKNKIFKMTANLKMKVHITLLFEYFHASVSRNFTEFDSSAYRLLLK